MKNSDLLRLAFNTWKSAKKSPGVAEVLVQSGKYNRREIEQITGVWSNHAPVALPTERLNPATLDTLLYIALHREGSSEVQSVNTLTRTAIDAGTHPSVIERLTNG